MIDVHNPKYTSLIKGNIMSKEQEDLCNFAAYGIGNAVVEALAGCGKSRTIEMMCLSVNPRKKILIMAFNQHIAKKLKEELKDYKNIDVHTYHSMGFTILKKKFHQDIELDDNKYKNYIDNNINVLSNGLYSTIKGGNKIRYRKNLEKLVDYARYNKAQSVKEIEKCAIKYGVQIVANECQATVDILNWGKSNISTIDYCDMIWLPYELGIKANIPSVQYDMIFIDEAQDSSPVQQNIIEICKGRSTRFIAVGDENQCVNSWAGADIQAFTHFKEMDNVKEFHLDVSYRCCKKVVDLVKSKYVPLFTAAPNAIEGEINYNSSIEKIQNGDIVLSRYTSLLVELYVKMIKLGKTAKIKGLGIGKEMVEEVEESRQNGATNMEEVIKMKINDMFKLCDTIIEANKCTMRQAIMEKSVLLKYDMILSLMAISEGITDIDKTIDKINEMFVNDDDNDVENENMIMLSTVHRAKGLERNNVYILCPSTMPSKLARREWELQAEDNIVYVAWSRAKKSLNFISEKEFPPHEGYSNNEKLYKEIMLLKERFGL